jgi:hypothetical protein
VDAALSAHDPRSTSGSVLSDDAPDAMTGKTTRAFHSWTPRAASCWGSVDDLDEDEFLEWPFDCEFFDFTDPFDEVFVIEDAGFEVGLFLRA